MPDRMSKTPQVSVVLPTYNEALSLPVVVPRILEVLGEAGLDGEVIVVDDDSPDGTAAVADELAKTLPLVVIRRSGDRGLAKAVLAGFDASRGEVCVVMDADGSHPAQALPAMVRLVLEDKADLVVGSRNLTGGGSRNWSVFSQMKSRLAATLAFGVTTMTDPTTGYMAVRRALLKDLPLNPVGWKIVLEIAVKASPLRIAEVPIVFTDRELGESKQSLLVFAQYLRHLSQLYAFRFPALAEFLRFCLVGLSGLFVDLGVVIAIKERLQLDTRLCAVFGFAAAVTTNFLLNRRWSFARAQQVPWLSSYAAFVLSSLLGLSVRILVMHGLIEVAELDQGRGYIFINLVGIAFATVVNFLGAKFFAFDPERFRFTKIHDPPRVDESAPFIQRLDLALKMAIGIALLCSLAAALWFVQPTSHDEVVNLNMARNLAADSQFLLRPSIVPGGHQNWIQDDLPLLGNLPFYPAVLSAFDHGLGTRGGLLLSWLCLGLTIFAAGRLLHDVHPHAGLLCAALLASSPGVLDLFGYIEFEPLLVALGMTGLWLFSEACQQERVAKAALGGVFLGLSFLVKMWLVAPFFLAALALVIVQVPLAKQRESTNLHKVVMVAIIAAVLTASLHLLLLAFLAPHDLPLWLETVYLGLFTGHGVSGEKLKEPAQVAPLVSSAWYYPWLLYRDHIHVLLLTLLGLPALLRRTQARVVRVGVMALAACLGLVFLSIPASKEPLYLLTVLPFVYGVATLSVIAFVYDNKRYRYVDASTARTIALAALLIAALAVSLWGLGAPLFSSYPRQIAMHVALASCVACVAYAWSRNPRTLPVALFGLAIVGVCAWLAHVVMSGPSTHPAETARPSPRYGAEVLQQRNPMVGRRMS